MYVPQLSTDCSAAQISPQRRGGEKREDEQVGAHDTEGRVALGRHVDPDEEPEPVAPEADQQSACDPELGQDGGRRRGGAEHHDDGGHDVEQEAVHRQ